MDSESINRRGEYTIQRGMEYSLISLIKDCIEKAEHEESKLTKNILEIPGQTSNKVCHFLNNICGDFEYLMHLHIGLLNGATIAASRFGNNGQFYGIDNWSEFGGSKEKLLSNLNGIEINLIEGDCFSKDVVDQIPYGINVYFFDGSHTKENHIKALTTYYPKLNKEFVYIVDDWNWGQVREGTAKAISDLNLNIVSKWELHDGWWNGVVVFILQKGPQ